MKKLLLLLALLLAAASPSLAFVVDGLVYYTYWDNDKAVYVSYQNSDGSSYSDLSGDLVIPASVTYEGVTYPVTSIGYHAFRYCSDLTSVTIPSSVTKIGDEAFYDCTGLTSITIPNSVTQIGNGAFTNTPWIINQPDGLVYAGSVAYYYKGDMPAGTSITIKEGIQTIRDYCFYNRGGLTSVTIPSSVTKIGESAFRDCTSLTTVIWNAKNCEAFAVTEPYGTYSREYHPFEYCYALVNVVIGNDVETIPENFMYECGSLKSIDFGNSVTSIGNYSFYDCTGLTSVTIPGSVTYISSNAFTRCKNLLYVTFEGDELPSFSYGGSFPEETALFVKSFELAKESYGLSYKVAIHRYDDADKEGISFTIPVRDVLHESGEYVNLTSVTFDDKEYKADGASSITLTHLFPYTSYPITLKWTRNGKDEQAENQIHTGGKIPHVDLTWWKIGATSFAYKIELGDDLAYLGEPCVYWKGTYKYDKGENVGSKGIITGLLPETTYYYSVKVGSYRGSYFQGYDRYDDTNYFEIFSTPKVSFADSKANMIKDTKVMLVASTNLSDIDTNCGFEWRRYDAPEEMPSVAVPCPVFGGNMAGTLEGLSKDVYYKFRPYMNTTDGRSYYGEWVAFITADADVKFSPMVYTYDDARSDDAGVMLSGVVIEGSDPVAEQGFEYWENYGAPATAKAERGDHLRIAASGERMTATISNNELVNGATYSYRSYAIVAGEEFYGDVKTFVADHGGIDGVEGISIDSRNADDPEALVNVYNINGQVVRTAVKRGEAIKGLLPGFYIVGGRKVLVK